MATLPRHGEFSHLASTFARSLASVQSVVRFSEEDPYSPTVFVHLVDSKSFLVDFLDVQKTEYRSTKHSVGKTVGARRQADVREKF